MSMGSVATRSSSSSADTSSTMLHRHSATSLIKHDEEKRIDERAHLAQVESDLHAAFEGLGSPGQPTTAHTHTHTHADRHAHIHFHALQLQLLHHLRMIGPSSLLISSLLMSTLLCVCFVLLVQCRTRATAQWPRDSTRRSCSVRHDCKPMHLHEMQLHTAHCNDAVGVAYRCTACVRR